MRSTELYTSAELERTLRILAEIVAGRDGAAYIPLFERVESELAARARANDARARARALLSAVA